MIVTEKVLIEVNNKNIHIFRKKLGSDIEIGLNEISVRDLSKGSHFRVEVKCDSCEVINNIEWRSYLKFTKDETDIYCCKKCNNVKVRKTNLERYGVVCNSQLESNKKKVKEKSHSSNIKRIDTLEKKYGEFYFNAISEKRKKTMFNKYGVQNSFQIEETKEKRKKSLKEKYGSETFNNPDKTKNTRICNGTQINDDLINDFIDYKKIAVNRTITIYNNNKDIINPLKYKRSQNDYHIDHKFSLKQGFLNNIPIEIITHPLNLQMIYCKENLSKQDSCCISLEDLLISIFENDIEVKINHTYIKEKYSNIKATVENILKGIKK